MWLNANVQYKTSEPASRRSFFTRHIDSKFDIGPGSGNKVTSGHWLHPTRRGEGRVHSHLPYLRPKRTHTTIQTRAPSILSSTVVAVEATGGSTPIRDGGTAQIIGKFVLQIVLRYSSSQFDHQSLCCTAAFTWHRAAVSKLNGGNDEDHHRRDRGQCHVE
ncbi:hypothetical protein C8Q74DRAFT_1218959 [Fomes fomentarius]|nr:hypothetical protein C8Q74DRAFT_1218959 [Fomes fomentarius]